MKISLYMEMAAVKMRQDIQYMLWGTVILIQVIDNLQEKMRLAGQNYFLTNALKKRFLRKLQIDVEVFSQNR